MNNNMLSQCPRRFIHCLNKNQATCHNLNKYKLNHLKDFRRFSDIAFNCGKSSKKLLSNSNVDKNYLIKLSGTGNMIFLNALRWPSHNKYFVNRFLFTDANNVLNSSTLPSFLARNISDANHDNIERKASANDATRGEVVNPSATRNISDDIGRKPFADNVPNVSASRGGLISTPIFYVNAAPHIGHVYSATIADAYHR